MKKYILILLLCSGIFKAEANVQYTLHYNTTLDQFEVGFISDVSFGAPAALGNSTVSLVFSPSYNIAVANATFAVSSSILGGTWGIADRATGTFGTTNGLKSVLFFSAGALDPAAVTAGQEYLLFRFTFGAGTNCAGTLRLHSNALDPLSPDDPLGFNSDFTSLLNINSFDYISTNTDLTMQNCATLSPVAVRFLSFTAVKSGDNGLLNWQVGNEDASVTRYEVYRSIDRINFSLMSTVAPKHNGLTDNSYDLTDPNLSALKSSGVIYYQVKQFDANGHYVLSEIRTLRVNDNAFAISLYPNPVRNYVNVQADVAQGGTETIIITDGSGREMSRGDYKATTGLNIQRVNTVNLAAGSYILTMRVGDQTKSIPFVKGN